VDAGDFSGGSGEQGGECPFILQAYDGWLQRRHLGHREPVRRGNG